MLTLILFAVPAGAADLLVGPGQTFTTISDAAAAAADGDRILVDPGTYPEPEIAVDGRALVIEAAGGAGTVLVEMTSGRNLFDLDNGASLTLVDLELDGLGERRLADVNLSTLVVDGCTVANTATPIPGQPGGTVAATDAVVELTFSFFDAAIVPVKNGGHIYAVRSQIALYSSSLFHGESSNGGAIAALDASTVTVEASHFDGNTADNGSAIDLTASDLTITSSNVTNNVGIVGTIRCSGGSTCAIDNTWFQGNTATTGAMLAVVGAATTTLSGNSLCGTPSGGSLVDLQGTTATIERSVFYDNALDSALVRVAADATASIVNNHFVAGAASGSGAALQVEGSATFVNNLVAYNAGGGPAVTVTGTLVERYNAWFDNTTAHADLPLAATDLVDVDPLIGPLLLGTCDLTGLIPSSTSPVIDAGDPSILDSDGTISDIGAYTDLVGSPLTDGDDDDNDGVPSPADCNDESAAIFPGNVEIACNDLDDDCDPSTLDAVDADADGVSVCEGDCDDHDPDRSALVEVYFDGDMDGFGVGELFELCGMPFNSSLVNGDCDDGDETVYPGATEIPYDKIDQDCSGADLNDVDEDGYRLAGDCDDDDPARNPGAPEIPDDGIDQNCTGTDATAVLMGGAGWTCGCSTNAAGGAYPWWAAPLLLWLTRRRSTRARRAPRAGCAAG